MDHIEFLCDIGELNWVFADSTSIDSFLQKVVAMVANHMHAGVCSIYLYDEENDMLSMAATKGLNESHMQEVYMRSYEGLTGLAFQKQHPFCISNCSKHPQYKFFEGLNEERFEEFCAVPIMRGIQKIGVLVVQRENGNSFSSQDIAAIRAVSNQLANIIENARMLKTLTAVTPRNAPVHARYGQRQNLIKGKTASPGFTMAKAVVENRNVNLESFANYVSSKQYTLHDFHEALKETEVQLEELQKQVEEKLSDVASLIFSAHLLLLKDTEFIGEIELHIEQGTDVITAVLTVAEKFIQLFKQKDSAYFQEKSDDIKDLTYRLLNNLVVHDPPEIFVSHKIVIARELFPSDILRLSIARIAGVVLVSGGVTSHVSILARSLGIPMIICDNPRLLSIKKDTTLIIDGDRGYCYINPNKTTISRYTLQNQVKGIVSQQPCTLPAESYTRDGVRIQIFANVNLLSDIDTAITFGAEGIGLYRTEFPFIVRATFPTEEEQYVLYQKVVNRMTGKELTFRTLDIGGDKVHSYYSNYKEHNPFLGMRSIRFTLHNIDIFFEQLRAILRAGAPAKLKILFPMVSSLEEFRKARTIVKRVMTSLQKDGIEHHPRPALGIMVEIPSVIDLIDIFAREVDFFSIGTNDLIQYLLAVDRTNEKVASLYIPHHPSVLRNLKKIFDAAQKYKKPVTVCGDMAQNPLYLPYLIAIGANTLSVDPSFIPLLRRKIAEISYHDAQQLQKKLLTCNTVKEIERALGIRTR